MNSLQILNNLNSNGHIFFVKSNFCLNILQSQSLGLFYVWKKKKSMPRAAPHPRYVSQNTFADALYRKKAGCNKLALAPRCGGNGSPPQVGLCGAIHHVFHRRHLASITRSSCTQQAGRLFIVRLCPRGGSAALGQESKTKCLGDLRLESDLQILELEQNMMRRHEREKLLFSVKATGQV